MNMIWVAFTIMFFLTGIFFLLGLKIGKKLPEKSLLLLSFLNTLLIVIFTQFIRDSSFLLQTFPLQNAIVYTNFLPLLMAFLLAISWHLMKTPLWRKLFFTIPCFVLTLYYSYDFLFLTTPQCDNVWQNGVCRQTTNSTCSAATAATLLNHYGIKATEYELSKFCFSTKKGTYLHGLYRGLRIKTVGTPWKVKVFSSNLEELRAPLTLPVILRVKLSREIAQRDSRYARDWGWKIDYQHSVILFGFKDNNLVEIGDPSVGRELWDVQSLKDLWYGEVVQIVPRHF